MLLEVEPERRVRRVELERGQPERREVRRAVDLDHGAGRAVHEVEREQQVLARRVQHRDVALEARVDRREHARAPPSPARRAPDRAAPSRRARARRDPARTASRTTRSRARSRPRPPPPRKPTEHRPAPPGDPSHRCDPILYAQCLFRQQFVHRSLWFAGLHSAPGRIRTSDPRIRSPPLCPLSYGRIGQGVIGARGGCLLGGIRSAAMSTVGIVSPGRDGERAFGERPARWRGSALWGTVVGTERAHRCTRGGISRQSLSLDAVVEASDVLLSVVPPAAALAVADAVEDSAYPHGCVVPLVADLNAIASCDLGAIAERLAPAGLESSSTGRSPGRRRGKPGTTIVYLVRTGGPVGSRDSKRSRVTISGSSGESIGLASAVKMSTASFYKGQTALLLAQAVRAARANGVLEIVARRPAAALPRTSSMHAPTAPAERRCEVGPLRGRDGGDRRLANRKPV